MESGSEYNVCDNVHIYDQEIGIASKKIKELSPNIGPQEDQKNWSRNPAENTMALRQAPLLSSVPQIVQYRFFKSWNFISFTFLTALCELKGTPSGQVTVVVYRNWYKYWNYSYFFFFFFFPKGKRGMEMEKMSVKKKTMQGPNFRAEEVCNGECSWDSCAEAYLS